MRTQLEDDFDNIERSFGMDVEEDYEEEEEDESEEKVDSEE